MASADIELRVQTAVPLYRCRTVLIPVMDEQTACDPPFALAPFKLIGVAPAHHHFGLRAVFGGHQVRSEEHTSELQSLMRISYAVFCLKKKRTIPIRQSRNQHRDSSVHIASLPLFQKYTTLHVQQLNE